MLQYEAVDTDAVQDESPASDTNEPQCPEDGQVDENTCIVFGSEVQDDANDQGGTDVQDNEGDTQEAEDNATDQTNLNEDQQDQLDGEVQDPAYTGSIQVDETIFQKATSTVMVIAIGNSALVATVPSPRPPSSGSCEK